MPGWLSFEAACASRWKRCSASASCAISAGRNLSATCRPSFGVLGLVHDSHPAAAELRGDAGSGRPRVRSSTARSERLLVDDERHLLRVAAVAALEHVDARPARSGRPCRRPDRARGGWRGPPRPRAGRAAASAEAPVAQRAVVGQRLLLEDVERRARDPALAQRLRERGSSTTGPRAVFTRYAVFFISSSRASSIRWIGRLAAPSPAS